MNTGANFHKPKPYDDSYELNTAKQSLSLNQSTDYGDPELIPMTNSDRV